MTPRIPGARHAVAVLAALLPALFPAIRAAQPAQIAQPGQPAGPRIDRPQLRLPAAPEQVVNVLASAQLNGGAGSAMVPTPLQLQRQFVKGAPHPFDLTRPTAERYSAFEDFRDATWQTYRAKGDVPLDWQRLLVGVQPQACAQGGNLTVHYQVRYQAKPTYAPVPGNPQGPPDQPAPGTPDRSAPTPEGVPTGNPPPVGLRPLPPPSAVSNVVSDSICALLQQ
jgi:hypothetical protein